MSEPQLAESHHPRPQWKSHSGFLMAAIGSAVGLGNIWRFPYLCYKNGGGAFLIPYFIALVVIGLTLIVLEFGLGHKMRGSAPLSFAKIGRRWEWVGWWAVIIVMFGIMLYYSTVIAWCLSYVFHSLTLAWGADPNHFFFNEFLQISSGPFDIGDIRLPIVASLVAVWFFSWLIVYSGVQNGVERANKIFIPLLLAMIVFLVIWSVNLKGAAAGIKVYVTPDFSKLGDIKIWLDAFSQIFFSLSLGFGIMIAYSSYLPRKTNLVKNALTVACSNSGFELFAGFAVFGTLGYMATTTGQPIGDIVKESVGLAFVAYPQAISLMSSFAKVFGVTFFALLVIAGLSSAISILEAFTSAVVDKFNYKRQNVVTFLCVGGFILSIIFASKGGLYWLDIADHFITHYGLVGVGLLECIIIGWVWKASKLRKHINDNSNGLLPKLWDYCVMFATPAVLLVLLVNDFIQEIKAPYEGYDWGAILLIGPTWLVLALIVSLFISNYPWQKEKELLNQE